MSTNRKKIDYWDVSKTRRRRSTIDWLTDSKIEDRQLTRCRSSRLTRRTDSRNKKIVYWLVDRVFISHHDELTDFQNKKINDWLSLSLTHDHSRRLTMRQVKVRFNHRSQRENLFILADSRSFSLTHVVSWRFVLLFHSWRRHASWFLSRELSFRWHEDALCKFFIQLTKTSCFVIFL